MSASRVVHGRIVAALAIAAWLAIGVGASQRFYLRIYAQDRAVLGRQLTELPYRQIPGLRALLVETDRRTPPGARILIALPHREWQRGYGYGFRRAQYVLQGKVAIPLLDRATDRIRPNAVNDADHVLCTPGCPPPGGFTPVFHSADGVLWRRAQ